MAGMWCVLPAEDATTLDVTLDAAARNARARGDRRTTDQLRADVLTALASQALATGRVGPPPARSCTCPGDRDPDSTRTSPHTKARCDARRCCGEPRDGAQAAGDQTSTHRPPDDGYRLGRIGGRRPQIRVTVPLGVLLPDAPTPHRGDDDPAGAWDPLVHAIDPTCVAELDGYGPLTPAVARALALGGTWTRLVTDPASGVVRDVGRTRYRPPSDLADLVRARDRTCVRPGCGVPAGTCDLDHSLAYHLGGPTAEENLGALCPTDHGMKTAGGYRVEQPSPGVFDFRLPTGHGYRREPDGSTTHLTTSIRASEDAPPPF
jgi:hypothetical protein